MNILLIGGGGREHAIAWKLAQSPSVTKLWAAPGNPGIARHAECVAVEAADHDAVIAFARAKTLDLIVIGPEAPLVEGLGDSLRAAGFAVFGPDRAAAQLEGSKGFTKDLCARAGIPTARYLRFATAREALAGLRNFGRPVVIKADGLAAGKGVVIAENDAEARSAIDAMFAGGFGGAGAEVVIEEFLTGEEVSLFALCDGTTALPFSTAQDHKRVGDGDTGPNTGGMGAYSPATVLTPELERRAMNEIVLPTVRAMREAGTPFVGVLYAGLMLTADGPKLIEYNARFGDPEAQVILPRFEGDLAELMLRVATGRLAGTALRFSSEIALTVVLAAPGYPAAPDVGRSLSGLDAARAAGALVFEAGTRASDDLQTAGGRILAVTALRSCISEARDAAYAAIVKIESAGSFYRRDIGHREIARVAVN